MARLGALQRSLPTAWVVMLLGVLQGCAAARVSSTIRFQPAAPSAGTPAAASRSAPLTIADISACHGDPTKELTIDPTRPLVVLVPGCHSSPEQFATLARALEAKGQQTVCFRYDDREKLERSARRLVKALEALKPHLVSRHIIVLGHSQGGLIARRALVRDRPRAMRDDGDFRYELVTVSSPFHGIESSADCGSLYLHVVTLGATVAVCRVVAGAKWAQIFPQSSFMRRPGSLMDSVDRYIKVVTDERDTCRSRDVDGRCLRSDYVFSLHEQYARGVDGDARITQVKAGHTEIVGKPGRPPVELMQLLEDEHVLAPAPAPTMISAS